MRNMTIRLKLIDKLKRSKVPDDTRELFNTMVVALVKAREGDDKLAEPNLESFKLLLGFFSDPTRRMWVLPSIAINPEGIFIAAWGVPGHDWLVTFNPPGETSYTHIQRVGCEKNSSSSLRAGHVEATDLSDIDRALRSGK